MTNLLPSLPDITEEDRENIALAIRRYGPPGHWLNGYPHYLKAAAALDIDKLALMKRKEVTEALYKGVPKYPEFLDTIRKLQSKCRPMQAKLRVR